MALIDEIHEHRNGDVINKLNLGTKGRRQPLILEITNAGFDRASVCWAEHEISVKLLEGVHAEDERFAYVCQLDPCEPCRLEGHTQPNDGCEACDDWRDERTWIKANLNLGISIKTKYVRGLVREAMAMPTKRDIVLRLNFCIWTAAHLTWIPR